MARVGSNPDVDTSAERVSPYLRFGAGGHCHSPDTRRAAGLGTKHRRRMDHPSGGHAFRCLMEDGVIRQVSWSATSHPNTGDSRINAASVSVLGDSSLELL